MLEEIGDDIGSLRLGHVASRTQQGGSARGIAVDQVGDRAGNHHTRVGTGPSGRHRSTVEDARGRDRRRYDLVEQVDQVVPATTAGTAREACAPASSWTEW